MPAVSDKRELRDFNISAPPGRILLDGYLLTFNKKTKEASITPLRTALGHYNITWMKDSPLCEDCVYIPDPEYDPAKHSIKVTIGITNNYDDSGTNYDAFDLRVIFVQVDTNGEDQFVYDRFDLVYPECDSTDLYADASGMPDDPDEDIEEYGGTNPFLQFYAANIQKGYEARDRALAYEDSDEHEFILAVNEEENYEDAETIEGLIMIDACQSYPPDEDPDEPYPNCPEPYQITFEEPDGAFPTVWAGQTSLWNKFWLYDHQHDYDNEGYSSDFVGALTFFFPDPELDFEIDGEVAYDSNPEGDGAKYKFRITPDSDVYAGLYEGIIKIQEVYGVNPVGPPLKRKIWANVIRAPIENYMTVGTHSRASSPVLCDWDNDNQLEYVFTTDKKIWAQDTDWGNAGKIHYPSYSGYYVGVPSIVGDNILLALNYSGPQNGDCMVVALDCSEDDGDEKLWETYLYGPAAGHPVPFDVSGGTYKTLVVCTGGEWDWEFIPPDTFVLYPSFALNIIDDEGELIAHSAPEPDPVYFGAPALMTVSGTTWAFVVRDEGGDGLTLEAWNLANVSSGPYTSQYLHVPKYYNLEPSLSPAIGKCGSEWVIYTPTSDKLYCHIFSNISGFTEKGITDYPDEDFFNLRGQVAIGDINGDGLEDVVVPLHGAVCAYTGYTGDEDTTLQLIWSYEPGGLLLYEFSSPSLIDCNGDHYLDVVTIANFIVEPSYHNIIVLDGSPYNNHKRSNEVDRIFWGFGGSTSGHYICPVLSELVEGQYEYLNIGMIFFGSSQYDNRYDQINSKFKFRDQVFKPWFKAYYSLNNWNNTQISAPY